MLVTCAFAQRYEVVAYQEDFESGADGWIHYDGAESPNNWHVYDFGGAQANVWWMGDTDLAAGGNIGGYYNHQYLVLDTPAQTLTASNATLTFKMRLGLEEPGTSTTNPEYNGWDSANIRISTNGGTTWTVLTGGSPAYDFTSSYAFGSEHGEGVNVPAWGNVVTTWTPVTFNLSAYVGQSVKIRFAFASDPAYSTVQQPNMFGFMVDDIAFGGYTNNGVDDGQMTFASMVPLGGDFWHIATEATAPSPTHVMKNQNPQGSYNDNMLNYLVSPSITLPSSGNIWADFQIMGQFSDAGTFPDVDYWGWEISPDNGTLWNAMSNPYATPEGSNYVYSDAPTVWASMIESYSLDGNISDFAGQTVKFRWYFQSNASITQGPGIMIDDFKIYNDVIVAAPENLAATVDGNTVTLNWDEPGSGGGGGEEGWIHYDGEFSDNSVGTGEAADFDVAAKWSAMGDVNSIYPYVGMNITKIKFVPAEANCVYSMRVWSGSANTLVVDQPVTSPTIGSWNEIVLTTPYTIPAGAQIMVGYRNNTQTGYPAGTDAGPAIDGFGNMIRLGGSWSTLLASDLDYNWNIRVYVADADGREYVLGELPQNDQIMSGTLSANTVRGTRASGYRVYRDAIMIDEVSPATLTYTDNNVEGGMHSYYVTAMYDANESPASNTEIVFVMPDMSGETYYDDGTAEQGLNVGSSRTMAVLHDWFNTPVTLKYAKVYVHEARPSSIIVRAHAVGADGMPGDNLGQVQYPASSVVVGWNYIPFPADFVIEDGRFFLVIMETPNASSIGVDTGSVGQSYVNLSAGWVPYETGEIMIRAIVYTGSDNEDGVAVAPRLAASNYPNPFNPTTTIAYSVPETGMTSVKVFNLKGQMINTLVNKEVAAGSQSITWNGKDASGNAVASGLYFVRVENSGKAVTRKMLLSK